MSEHPLQAKAIAKYYQLVRSGMNPQDAKDIFAPINEFLYDYVKAHNRLPAGLNDTATLDLFGDAKGGQTTPGKHPFTSELSPNPLRTDA